MAEATIVVVDDEKAILDSLKRQLRHVFGTRFAYETAENVREAWEVIEELVADSAGVVVVVSDWLMPDTKGDVFLAELKARHPSIGRIMLTGHADEAAIARAHEEASVHWLLEKPWRPEDLESAIEKALDP